MTTVNVGATDDTRPEVAYYYPATFWYEGHTSDWIKNILLFFDQVATLVPDFVVERAIDADPTLVGPLVDQGILRFIEPKEIIDPESLDLMFNDLFRLVEDADDKLTDRPEDIAYLSTTRMGLHIDAEMTRMMVDHLVDRGLAEHFAEGALNFRINRDLRDTILCLWSQYLIMPGRTKLNLELMPITDDPGRVDLLMRSIATLNKPSLTAVVALDVQAVSIDLASVPLDEVLAFREDHGKEYRAYRRGLNSMCSHLSLQEDPEMRMQLLSDRTEELIDLSADLRRRSRLAFKLVRMLPFGLGLAGAAIAGTTGGAANFASDAVSALGAVPTGKGSGDLGAYSYLFGAQSSFSSRRRRW